MINLQNTKTNLVIIQATPFCNINCRYCYLPDRSSKRRITSQTLSRISEVLFSSPFISHQINILWHAGEPLVLPVSFYEHAFSCIEKFNTRGVKIVHNFQTNGTLIDQEWCDFIKRYNIKIGVSLDGPKHVHDSHRVDRAGRGTFERAMQGIALLQKNNIDVSIIMVLTRYALDYPDDIWQFFMDHNIKNIAFNTEEVEGVHRTSSLETEEDMLPYKEFFRRIFELRDACETPPYIRELDFLLGRFKYSDLPIWSSDSVPLATLNFDCDGNVSTFSPELLTTAHPNYGNFILNNVHNSTLEDILTNEKFVIMRDQIQEGISRCRETCEYFMFCGGGIPSNKLSENGTFSSCETMNCRLTIQSVTDVMLDHLETLCKSKGRDNGSVVERVASIKNSEGAESISASLKVNPPDENGRSFRDFSNKK